MILVTNSHLRYDLSAKVWPHLKASRCKSFPFALTWFTWLADLNWGCAFPVISVKHRELCDYTEHSKGYKRLNLNLPFAIDSLEYSFFFYWMKTSSNSTHSHSSLMIFLVFPCAPLIYISFIDLQSFEWKLNKIIKQPHVDGLLIICGSWLNRLWPVSLHL